MNGRPAIPPAAAGEPPAAVTILVHLPGVLAAHAGGGRHLRVPIPTQESTVGAVLNALGEHHPGVRQRVLDDQGGLRPHVNVFVGGENVRMLQGLATPVSPAEELWVIPAVSGGAVGTRQGEVLGVRALNRALLERQLLLDRRAWPAAQAIEHLVGLQSQAPSPPYVGLWTRLDGFDPEELARLLVERAAVRIAVMRGTVHLVSARDCLWLRPLVQPLFDRGLHAANHTRAGLDGVDVEAVVAQGRALLEEQPRTAKELGELLEQRWPGHSGAALARAVRLMLPLVQVPPRGLWGRSGQARHTTAEAWLGRPLEAGASLGELVVRYLAAFGPATVGDVQVWSGLTGLGEVVEALRPRLRAFRDEHGRELLDLPDAPRPDPDTPAPVRFLPEFDNVLLSHSDRDRIIGGAHRKRIFTPNGLIPGTVLVDGVVRGTWKIESTGPRRQQAAALRIQPFEPLTAADRDALTAEGHRLLAFAAADATTHTVQFATPS